MNRAGSSAARSDSAPGKGMLEENPAFGIARLRERPSISPGAWCSAISRSISSLRFGAVALRQVESGVGQNACKADDGEHDGSRFGHGRARERPVYRIEVRCASRAGVATGREVGVLGRRGHSLAGRTVSQFRPGCRTASL